VLRAENLHRGFVAEGVKMSASTSTMALVLLLLLPSTLFTAAQSTYSPAFSGTSAFGYLEAQCDFGPRPPGSENLSLCRDYIVTVMESFGWVVRLQNFTYRDTECVNIIASWPSETNSTLLLGAHYDTRPRATEDPIEENRLKPILGANDGASGVAVLMELARVLPLENRSAVGFVFFDAEDSGQIDGWDWIQGSRYYASQLNQTERDSINAMILLDMVGDANVVLAKEVTSTDSLQDAVWDVAASLGYGAIFVNRASGSVLDDHRPFLEAGIPALDIIEVPFPWYWHTLEDTPDKCSPSSLQAVGRVMEAFIVGVSGNAYPLDLPFTIYIGFGVISVIIISYAVIRLQRR
jgi:glutaminyl-peptide cyclotransferase